MEKENVSFLITEETKNEMIDHYQSCKTNINGEYVIFSALTPYGIQIIIYSSKKGYKAYFNGIYALEEAKKWSENASVKEPKKKIESEWIFFDDQIGSDEVGTGDFFGPMIVVASFVPKTLISYLKELGVDDSKKLTDKKILEIVPQLLTKVTYSMLCLDNPKYNQMISKGQNMNSLKAILHNTALLNVEKKIKANRIPLFIDQFCEPSLFFHYCFGQDQVINNVTFKTKGESYYPSVAVSSLIARYTFIKRMDELSAKYQMEFPKGAGSNVDKFAQDFLQKYGYEEILKVCKSNFSNLTKLKKD